jgi:mycoredoxin
MGRSWRLAGLAVIGGVAVAAIDFRDAPPVSLAVLLVFFAGVAVVLSPLAFPRSLEAADALARSAADGRPIIYWRPGCVFCMRLRASLGRAGRRAHWVDIWSDPDAAAAVRAITGGDETVPTVVAGAQSFVNPDPSRVRELLAAAR